MSQNLKLIASMAIIPSGIDVAAATARRIPVTTLSPIVTEATAAAGRGEEDLAAIVTTLEQLAGLGDASVKKE